MGMGYGANFAWTISIETMKKLLPAEMESLANAIEADKEDGGDLEWFFRWCVEEGCYADATQEPEYPKASLALEELQKNFALLSLADGYNLQIHPFFHDSNECGDRYDDINGACFWVEGVEVYTPAGEKMLDYLEKSLWVTFG